MDDGDAPTTATNGLDATASPCSGCGQDLAADARFCPYCGAPRWAVAPIVDLSDVDVMAAVTGTGGSAPAAGDATTAEEIGARPADLPPPPATSQATSITSGNGAHDGVPTSQRELGADEATSGTRPLRRRRRTMVLAGVGIAVLAAVAATIGVLMDRGGPGYDLAGALTAASQTSAEVWADADRATTLAQLREAGGAAEVARADLTTLRAELVEIGNVDDRRAAEAFFDAQLDALEALASLAALDATEVAAWPDVAGAIAETVAGMEASRAALVERDLATTSDLAATVEAVAGRLEVVLANIVEKLDAWAAEVNRIESDKAAQSKALADYVTAFRSQIERYAQLRVALGEFTDRLLNEGGTYSAAYADLGGAVAQRREVHASMSALAPPAPLVPAHTAIVAAVRDSIGAVESAVQGLEQYQFDWYYTLESTPGWQAFTRTSRQISETYTGAVGNWEAAVAAEEKRIAAITTPKRPAV